MDDEREPSAAGLRADRLGGMDASGISVAILSHTVPGVQGIVEPVRRDDSGARDQRPSCLRGRQAPTRYAGFASIALQDPKQPRRSSSNARSLASG